MGWPIRITVGAPHSNPSLTLTLTLALTCAAAPTFASRFFLRSAAVLATSSGATWLGLGLGVGVGVGLGHQLGRHLSSQR